MMMVTGAGSVCALAWGANASMIAIAITQANTGRSIKKRDIRRDYRAAGFRERQGRGDHVVYSHPLVPKHYAVDGKEGADALPYDERNLRQALDALAEAERREQP